MKILIEANDSNDYQLLADLGWDDVELLISGILRVGCRVMIAQHSQSGSAHNGLSPGQMFHSGLCRSTAHAS